MDMPANFRPPTGGPIVAPDYVGHVDEYAVEVVPQDKSDVLVVVTSLFQHIRVHPILNERLGHRCQRVDVRPEKGVHRDGYQRIPDGAGHGFLADRLIAIYYIVKYLTDASERLYIINGRPVSLQDGM